MECLSGQTLKHLINGKPMEFESLLIWRSKLQTPSTPRTARESSTGHQARQHLRHRSRSRPKFSISDWQNRPRARPPAATRKPSPTPAGLDLTSPALPSAPSPTCRPNSCVQGTRRPHRPFLFRRRALRNGHRHLALSVEKLPRSSTDAILHRHPTAATSWFRNFLPSSRKSSARLSKKTPTCAARPQPNSVRTSSASKRSMDSSRTSVATDTHRLLLPLAWSLQPRLSHRAASLPSP